MDFHNRTAIITGGANGIGEACAESLYQSGANVVILDIAEPAVNIEDQRRMFIRCDVSKAGEVRSAVDIAYERFGSIDILINNVGIQHYGKAADTTEEDWDRVMHINLRSYFLCTKYAIPHMLHRQRGVIINMSSIQAFVTQEKVCAYATTKAAILGFTRSVAIDYAPHIRCVSVCPGSIDTPLLRNAINLSPDPAAVMEECEQMHLLKRIGTPHEVASLVKYLCSDDASFITGESIRIDGGLGLMIQGSKKD